ncbi:MAG: Fic family protein, partial [Thioalkalivibrio sp.]|nr:Fic family protein [Thioalkalivibrio sp.]
VLYQAGAAALVGEPPEENDYVTLSRVGARVRALVRRPMMDRQPVGYDVEMLRHYEPGETWYLPEPERRQLHEQGRSADPNHPAGTFARAILERLLIDLSWASSSLEGNTYSRLETQNLIQYGQKVAGANALETLMVLNHKRAIELLVDNAETIDFNPYTLNNVHAALSEGLLKNPEDEGRLREVPVDITGTPYRPLAIPQQIRENFDLLLAKARAIPDPFEQSFFAMVHVPYLQPYIDVNKRVSRLACNIPLIKANLAPMSFVDVPRQSYMEGTLGVYENRRIELLRDVFLWAYERSCSNYRAVRDTIPADAFRLKYREEFRRMVSDVIRTKTLPGRDAVRNWALSHELPNEDLAIFEEKGLALVLAVRDDTARRYDVLPSEFRAWQEKIDANREAS